MLATLIVMIMMVMIMIIIFIIIIIINSIIDIYNKYNMNNDYITSYLTPSLNSVPAPLDNSSLTLHREPSHDSWYTI